MSGGWGCAHEVNKRCAKINNLPCDPGMKGCELHGRFRFADESKNTRYREKQARAQQLAIAACAGRDSAEHLNCKSIESGPIDL